MVTPLFGIPMGPEIVVLLLVLLFFVVPIALVAVLLVKVVGGSDEPSSNPDAQRLAGRVHELEQRVEELESEDVAE